MAQLTFYDDRHIYELDGIRIPSVSEILRFGSREVYRTIDQYTLDRAADRGTRVHAACEALDIDGQCEAEDDIAPYIRAYGDFLARYRPRWEAIERAVYHEADWFAGRLDRVGALKGKDSLCVVDIKTSYQIKRQIVQPQLSAYASAWAHMGNDPPRHLFALHLKRDGKYSLLEFNLGDTLWRSYLTIHNSFKKRGER